MERVLDEAKISDIGNWIGIGSTCWFAGLGPGHSYNSGSETSTREPSGNG